MSSAIAFKERLHPVKEGVVTSRPAAADEIDLLGSKCSECGEVSLGVNAICLNCGGTSIEQVRFSEEGVLWTYTVVRHRPPGGYLGSDNFQPFGLGLVELPQGLRIMAPLEGDIDGFRIGMKLVLRPWILRAPDGAAYLAFRFAPATH